MAATAQRNVGLTTGVEFVAQVIRQDHRARHKDWPVLADLDDDVTHRFVLSTRDFQSNARSRAGAECVSPPTLIRSTPV